MSLLTLNPNQSTYTPGGSLEGPVFQPTYEPAPTLQLSYVPAPSYAPQTTYVPAPSYAPQTTYVPAPSYAPQATYVPAPSYSAPAQLAGASLTGSPSQPAASQFTPLGFLEGPYGALGARFASAPGMEFFLDTRQPAAAEEPAPADVAEQITTSVTDLGTSVVEEGAATAFQLEARPQPTEDPVRRAAEEYVKLEIPDYDHTKGVLGWLTHPDSAAAVEGRSRVAQERAARVEELVGGEHVPDLFGYYFGKSPRHDAYRRFLDAKVAARGGEPPSIDPEVRATVGPIVAAADKLSAEAEAEGAREALLNAVKAESPGAPLVEPAVAEVVAEKRVERATTFEGRLLEAMWEQDPEAAAGVEWTKHVSEWQSYRRQNPDVAADAVPKEFADIAKMSDSDIITKTALYKDNAGVKNFRKATALYAELPADVQVTLMGDGGEIKVGGWSAVRDAGIKYFTGRLEAEIASKAGLPVDVVEQIVGDALSGEARGQIVATLNSSDVSPGDGLASLKSAFAPVDTAVRDLVASKLLSDAGVDYNGMRVTGVRGLDGADGIGKLTQLADRLGAIGRLKEAGAVRAAASQYRPGIEKLKETKYDPLNAHDQLAANLEAKVKSEWDDGFEAQTKKLIGIKLNEAQGEREEALNDLLNADPADYPRALARFQRRWDMISQKAEGDIDVFIAQNSSGKARSTFLRDVRNDGRVDWNVENMLMAGTLLLSFYGPFERRESERRAERRADRQWEKEKEWWKERAEIEQGYRMEALGAQLASAEATSGKGRPSGVQVAQF